jgi:DNA polymerase-3 subunit gamma/tau
LAPNGPGAVDVVELDAASHGGVNDTRELREHAFYTPAQSRYRIFIIDEAHMVSKEGFNALLKIVEEPPEHLIFVFATTEPDKVLATIRSRTHHYPFRLLAPRAMRGLIEGILASEDVEIDDAVFPLVIRAGGGSPRDTLSVLDQLLAGADGNRVHYQRALEMLGVTDAALIDDAVDALSAGDAAALFGAVEAVMDAGHDPRRFATDLLERFRDLIVLQAVPDAVERGVVYGPGDVLDRMREQAHRVGPATLARYAEVVHAGLGEMRGATAPRLLLEVVCARLLMPSASDTESALLQRVERIETRLDISIPVGETAASAPPAPAKQYVRRAEATPTPAPAPAPASAPAPAEKPVPVHEAAPAPAPAPAPVEKPVPAEKPVPVHEAAPAPEPPVASPAPPGQLDAAAVRSMWPTVREKVRDRSKPVYAMLDAAIVRAVDGDTLIIAHQSAPLAKRLTEQHNADVIRDALKDALGVDWRLRCEVGTGDQPAAPLPEEPRADPVDTRRAEEDSMIAEVGHEEDAPPRRDPEEAALELLQSELGARRIDG